MHLLLYLLILFFTCFGCGSVLQVRLKEKNRERDGEEGVGGGGGGGGDD